MERKEVYNVNKWPSKLAALLLVASLCLSAGCSAQNLAKLPASGAVESFSVKVNLTNQRMTVFRCKLRYPSSLDLALRELNAKIKQISNDGIAQVKQDTEGMENSAGAGSLFIKAILTTLGTMTFFLCGLPAKITRVVRTGHITSILSR